ncbi:hypothetical protein BDA99DRAFT_539677 [Phascolomyces articulosus]|uniref:Vacuolar segregation protein 7 n=1 Tax=Phascolomyces articulosus TaxID=60185 RepID=A0AAD5K5I8_9FUNG|nr:hypothetical protein BDA99DRAFT_539677 [Phascolomyces articulosus]
MEELQSPSQTDMSTNTTKDKAVSTPSSFLAEEPSVVSHQQQGGVAPTATTSTVSKSTIKTNSPSQPTPLQSGSNRRPMFPTLHNDHQLGRDLLLSNNFDRNMTVEKARFEAPQTLITPADEMPPSLSYYPPDESLLSSSAEGRFPIANSVPTGVGAFSSSISTNGGSGSVGSPLIPSSSLSPYSTLTDRGSENERGTRRSTNKKRKRPSIPINGNASPSEVFHRNLIDAVSNVEGKSLTKLQTDSDENERYVYHTSSHSDLNYPYLHRVYTMPTAQEVDQHNNNNNNGHRWFNDWFRPSVAATPPHASLKKKSGEEDLSSAYRPKLRSYVMDYPHRSKKDYYDNHYPDKLLRHSPSRRSNRRMFSYGGDGGGYTSDDEEATAPLLLSRTTRQQKPSSSSHDSSSCGRICFNVTIGLFAAFICIFLLTLYRATPLTDMTVQLGRVLASDKELIFDIQVKANNWNWWTVHIADADIGVFAFSQIVPLMDEISSYNSTTNGMTVTGDPVPEYLGNFYHFDEPLSFPSTFIINNPAKAISQIRIKNPGADKTGSERWSRMIRYPYGLVTRGVLKYNPISFAPIYPQSAVICNVARVDPTTGTVSEDPDQGYCAKKDTQHEIHRF